MIGHDVDSILDSVYKKLKRDRNWESKAKGMLRKWTRDKNKIKDMMNDLRGEKYFDTGDVEFQANYEKLIFEAISQHKSSKDLDEYKKELKQHDWYYQMSDDMRVVTKGSKHLHLLMDLYEKLDDKEKKDAFNFYNKEAPKRNTNFNRFKGV